MKISLKNLLLFFLVLHLAVFNTGCIGFYIGSAVGALGGYAISKDTIQGETDKGYSSLQESALKVLNMMEATEINDGANGEIKAKIGRSKVVITMEQLTPSTVRVKVKSRRNIFPNLALSQKLYIRIIEHAK